MISSTDDPLTSFGEFTEVRANKSCRDFPKILDNVLLTPYRSGYITLKEEKIQERNQRDNFSKTLRDILPKSEANQFAFADFIMHPDCVEDQVGRIAFPEIMTRIKEFYKLIETGFDKYSGGLDSKNHNLLEYQFFCDGYVLPRPEDKKEYHLLLFSAVESKETIESKLLRYPNLFVNPGHVLTMVVQMAEALRTLIFETNIFGDDQNSNTKPLLPRLPGLLLGDIWIFGKWYFKMNWAFGLFEPTQHHFLSKSIREQIKKDLKNGKTASREDFYNYNLYSLGQIALKYLKPGYKYQEKETEKGGEREKEDLKELKKHLEVNFMNEFKEEGELLVKIVTEMLLAEKTKSIFKINDFINNNKEYQDRDPTKNLLMEVFEEKKVTAKARLDAIQKAIVNQNVPRGLELKVLHDLIKKTDMKRPIGVFTSVLNDTEVPPSQTSSQPAPPRGPAPPFLDIGYPLDTKDICNINPNASNERISCQVHPLFDKDFFVYRAVTSQLMLSIEFSDDLTYLLSSLSQTIGYVNAELDQERRVVFRSALNTQAFENELESHINALDTLALIATLVVRKLNFCIEYEEFGRIGKNVRLILDEVDFHMQRYKNRKYHLTHEFQF